MGCLDKNLAKRFVDGKLPSEHSDRVLEHVRSCEACRARVAEATRMSAVSTALSEVGEDSDGSGDPITSDSSRVSYLDHLDNRSVVTGMERAIQEERSYDLGQRHPERTRSKRMAGESLEKRLARAPRLSQPQALQIFYEVCSQVRLVHRQGMFHHDLKPSGIWLDPSGAIRVMGLDLVRDADVKQGRTLGPSAGHGSQLDHHYLGPDGRAASRSSEIYGLGLLAVRLLGGRIPLDPESKYLEKIPRRFHTVLRRCFVEPEKRYGSVRALMDAMRRAEGSGGLNLSAQELRQIGATAGIAGAALALVVFFGSLLASPAGLAPSATSAGGATFGGSLSTGGSSGSGGSSSGSVLSTGSGSGGGGGGGGGVWGEWPGGSGAASPGGSAGSNKGTSSGGGGSRLGRDSRDSGDDGAGAEVRRPERPDKPGGDRLADGKRRRGSAPRGAAGAQIAHMEKRLAILERDMETQGLVKDDVPGYQGMLEKAEQALQKDDSAAAEKALALLESRVSEASQRRFVTLQLDKLTRVAEHVKLDASGARMVGDAFSKVRTAMQAGDLASAGAHLKWLQETLAPEE